MSPIIKKLNMPLPPSKSAVSKARLSISELAVNESVQIINVPLNTLNGTIQRCQNKLDRKFTVRKLGENNYGVWRIS